MLVGNRYLAYGRGLENSVKIPFKSIHDIPMKSKAQLEAIKQIRFVGKDKTTHILVEHLAPDKSLVSWEFEMEN